MTEEKKTEIKDVKENKGLFFNIYFVGFLFAFSVFDCVRRALEHDYKVANIVFLVFSLYLLIKIIRKKNQQKPIKL